MINMVCEVSEGVKPSQMKLDSGYLRIDENDAKRDVFTQEIWFLFVLELHGLDQVVVF